MKNATVFLTSEYGLFIRKTDSTGILNIEGLPSANYQISIRMNHPSNNSIVIIGVKSGLEIEVEKEITDTIWGSPTSSKGMVINELYTCGSVNNFFYFSDQFIEIYNSSDSVKFLDGIQIFRVSDSQAGKFGPGSDYDKDGDIDGVTYAFKFPGKYGEKNYPFYPKTFLVLAANAIDHRTIAPKAVDLSKADWEFYNQFSLNDLDNPNVKNLENIRPDEDADFYLRLDNDIIVIADGTDENWTDGINLNSILDGVEYQSDSRKQKTLDASIDKMFAISPSTYSGKSLKRISNGYDINNSAIDFIISTPTPGY